MTRKSVSSKQRYKIPPCLRSAYTRKQHVHMHTRTAQHNFNPNRAGWSGQNIVRVSSQLHTSTRHTGPLTLVKSTARTANHKSSKKLE